MQRYAEAKARIAARTRQHGPPAASLSARDELVSLINEMRPSDPHVIPGGRWPEALANQILAAGYRKPRSVTTAEELDAQPEWTMIRVVKRKGHQFATCFEKVGSNRWMALDPTDKSDGEDLWDAQIIVRFNEDITVLYVPEEAR